MGIDGTRVTPPSARVYRSLAVVMAREMRSHSRNPLLWTLVILAGLLGGGSAHMAAEDLKGRASALAELEIQRNHDRSRAGGQVTGRLVEHGFRAIRQIEPLSAIVTGLERGVPDFWDFGPSGRRTGHQALGRSAEQMQIDLEFVIRVVLGLLAVMLGLQSVGEERSSGTLLALLGQSLAPGVVIVAKLAAGATILAISTAVSLVFALMSVYLTDVSVGMESMVFISAIGLVGWMYLLTYFAMGALVASVIPSFRAALVSVIVMWLLAGVIALPVVQLTARSISNVPPESLVEAESDRIARDKTEQVQVEMGDAFVDMVPKGNTWTTMERDRDWTVGVLTRLHPLWERHAYALRAELEGVQARASRNAARKNKIVKWLSALSPGAQLTGAATNLAGTGDRMASRWDQATARYQAELNQVLFLDPPRFTILVPRGPREAPDQSRWVVVLTRRPLPTFQTLPAFSAPATPRISHRLVDAGHSILAILIYCIGFSMAAAMAFIRMKV